jgi:hypothetical protein
MNRERVITPSEYRDGLEIEKAYSPTQQTTVVNFYIGYYHGREGTSWELKPCLSLQMDDAVILLAALKTLVEGK